MARLAFLGTPPVAASVLSRLVEAGHEVRLVVSAPDKRRGRGGGASPSPVRRLALELGLPTSDQVAEVTGCGAELGVVVAFGRLVPARVLAALPMVNLHFSLLPRWRGAAPVERAILAGDQETGVCLMALDEGLDTGPVLARATVAIGEDERADELRDRLGTLGTSLLLAHLAGAPETLAQPEDQVGEASYAEKLRPEELVLDWARPAVELHRVVRVGRAWTTFRHRRLLVHRSRLLGGPPGEAQGSAEPPGTLSADGAVATGSGQLGLLEVQLEGRSAQPFATFAAGARLTPGERLGAP